MAYSRSAYDPYIAAGERGRRPRMGLYHSALYGNLKVKFCAEFLNNYLFLPKIQSSTALASSLHEMNIQVQVWTLFDVRGNLGSDSAEGAPGPDTDVFD